MRDGQIIRHAFFMALYGIISCGVYGDMVGDRVGGSVTYPEGRG